MGADEQTINALVGQILHTPQPSVAEQPSAANPARRRSSSCNEETARRRPLARGVLGFRIRTAPKKKYSVEKDQPDPPTGAAAPETTSHPQKPGCRTKKLEC